MIYYVYILRDPRKNNEPFYVGKGKDKRALDHIIRYDSHNKLKSNIIKKIQKENLSVIIEYYQENMNEQDAFILESKLINDFGRRDLGTGPLTNLTNGGEGVSGYIMPQIQRDELNKSRIDSGIYKKIAESNRGQKRSDETKEKMSKAHIGKKLSESQKNKISQALTGHIASEEVRQKLSNAKRGDKNPMFGKVSPKKGKPSSEETKKKIRDSRSKQVFSEETKKKMSDSAKNKTLYVWYKDDIEILDTAHGFVNRFPEELKISGANYLIRNRTKTYKGWRVKDHI